MCYAKSRAGGVGVRPGDWLRGRLGAYELRVVGFGWRRLCAGSLWQQGTDLELESEDGRSWIAVRVIRDFRVPVSDLLRARRGLIAQTLEIESETVRSELLPGGGGVAATRAEFRVSGGRFLPGTFAVTWLDLGDCKIELMGYAADARSRSEVVRILASARRTPRRASALRVDRAQGSPVGRGLYPGAPHEPHPLAATSPG